MNVNFFYSAHNEPSSHTYEGVVKVEMQQFDKHGYNRRSTVDLEM